MLKKRQNLHRTTRGATRVHISGLAAEIQREFKRIVKEAQEMGLKTHVYGKPSSGNGTLLVILNYDGHLEGWEYIFRLEQESINCNGGHMTIVAEEEIVKENKTSKKEREVRERLETFREKQMSILGPNVTKATLVRRGGKKCSTGLVTEVPGYLIYDPDNYGQAARVYCTSSLAMINGEYIISSDEECLRLYHCLGNKAAINVFREIVAQQWRDAGYEV